MGEASPLRSAVVASGFARTITDAMLAVLVAPVCAACAKPLDAPTRGAVCGCCWARIVPLTPPLCDACGDPLPTWRTSSLECLRCPRCRRRPGAVSIARAIGAYDGSLRDIVHALKYDGRRSLAAPLAARMRGAGAEVLRDADLAVPVPLHRLRRLSRGFNQAADLARHLGLPTAAVLRRTRATPSQTDLPAAKRHSNVRGAFAMRRRARVAGLSIVLVDDVSTTGATLDACARVLKDAGARDVRALTAARAVSRQQR
jgi:ComF family protein